jgi:hypothetical protein
MSRQSFSLHALVGLLALAMLTHAGNVFSADSQRDAGPGLDRVGKNVVGGMRGIAGSNDMLAAQSARLGETSGERAMAGRKGEFSKRLFWIMLSMR